MFRATALQLTLSTVAAHPQRARLEAAIPPELRDMIEGARPSEWLPASNLMVMFEVIWQVLDRDEFINFYLLQIERARANSTFSQFMTRLVNLLSASPAATLRHLPRGLDLVQRDAGRMQVESEGPSSAKIVVSGLPSLMRNICYATSLIASIKSSALMVGYTAEVEMDARELSIGIVHYRMRWPS